MTQLLGAAYGHMPDGRSSNVVGGVPSSWQRVAATAEPPSVALTVGLTAKTYQPFTSGLAGSSANVVTGGLASILKLETTGASLFPAVSRLAAYTVCVPSVVTSAPAPR